MYFLGLLDYSYLEIAQTSISSTFKTNYRLLHVILSYINRMDPSSAGVYWCPRIVEGTNFDGLRMAIGFAEGPDLCLYIQYCF